ncbi:MAG: hypothetical protein AAEJ16_00810 [Arenicellales bacterium]
MADDLIRARWYEPFSDGWVGTGWLKTADLVPSFKTYDADGMTIDPEATTKQYAPTTRSIATETENCPHQPIRDVPPGKYLSYCVIVTAL